MLYYSIMDNNNILEVDDNPEILELINLFDEYWAENKYTIRNINPFEIEIKLIYKDNHPSATIKYNIYHKTYRCKHTVQGRKRTCIRAEQIRKQLEIIYINFNKKPLEITI